MNNLKKRCLTLLLSLAMIVTYMPTSMIAYAVDGDNDPAQAEQQIDADAPAEEAVSEDASSEEAAVSSETPVEKTAADEALTEEETPAEEPAAEEAAAEEEAPAETEEPAVVEAEEDAEEADGTEEKFTAGELKASDNQARYEVTVSYGEDARIPEGAKLVLTPFEEGGKKFEEAKESLIADENGNSAFSQATEEEQKNLGMAAFDLTIYDKDGEAVEPQAEVDVNFMLNKLPEGADAEALAASMEIQHLNESSGEVVVEKIATVDSQEAKADDAVGEIAVNESKETASVETAVDAFSTFTITWSHNGNRTVTVHYVDESGNELDVSNTGTGVITDLNANSSSPAFLIYDINGYEYSYTYRNNDSNRIAPLLTKSNSRWNYMGANSTSTSELSNGDNIYVVYKPKAATTTGGTPKVDTDEKWPDQEDPARKPQFTKSSTNNGNGTNNISLTITGPEKPVEKSTPADVIVVFDVSGSMGDDMNGQTRLARAKTATKTMANTLLNGQNSNVRMALISFSTTAATVQDFTNSYSTFSSKVDDLSADGGTNWEQALQLANQMQVRSDAATFVVFVTDGDPTFRVSRGNVTNSGINSEIWDNSTYVYYRNNHVYGEGNDDSQSRNFNFAVEQVKAIAGANKNFYAIGISNSVTKVQNLTTQGGVAADHAFIAANSTAMDNAFKSITESIKSVLGFGDIEITDGITSLTNAEMKVMQTVDPDSFKYYRYGGENNKYGDDYANKTEWTTREADGCAAAAYSESDGAVHWDMGESFQLESDVTYVVEFTVWPSQNAYDLVADLNNGIRTYASLNDAEKAQVVEVTAPTETTTGTYALKTNTDEVNATYNRTTKTGETVSVSDTQDVDAQYIPGTIENMSLASDYITVKKEWNNAIPGDEREAASIDLTVTKDGAAYITPVTLDENNNWESGKEYISAGLITKAANGKYNVREKGHDYTVTEPANFSYYWDLKADVYRPMVIDGTLYVLTKTDTPTGTEGTDYFVIDGNKYQIGDGNTTLNAANDRRSNLNLSKTINGTNPKPDAVFRYTITITDINGGSVWFSAQDENGEIVPIESHSANVTAEVDGDDNPTGSYSVPSGAEFEISIKAGWNVRFFNLPTGSTYSINESGMEPGYGFDTAVTSVSGDGTEGSVNGTTATGTIDKPNNIFGVAYTNKVTGAVKELEVSKDLVGRDWANSDSFDFRLEPVDDAPMPADAAEDEEGNKSKTVSVNEENKAFGFGDILFTEAGTYEYTITEVKPANPIPGVEYDTTAYKVKVVVSGTDELTAAVTYDDNKSALTVKNTLTPVKVQPEVTKTLEGRQFKDSDSFTFSIARASGEPDDTPMPSGTTATANKASDWKAIFGEMSFNKVGEYKYTITETKGSLDGVTYNSTPVNVVVNVTVDDNNALTYTVMYDGKNAASVENTFAPAKQALEVTKILTGRDWESGDEFTFTLAAGESKNTAGTVIETPMPAETTATAKMDDPATTDVNETIAKFGEIAFSEAGTYKYTITEQDGSLDGVTYNTASKEVTVVVVKNADTNALSIQSVTYAGGANVENKFEPSGEVPLQITKTLSGRDWEDNDTFEFTISKAESSPAGTPMPNTAKATATKSNPVASFGTVKFEKAGTYTYNVVETKGSADGITYDTITHTIVVTVTKGTDNKLSTEVVYDGNKANEGLTSLNTFKPASAEIEATKKFNNWGKADSFTFKLAAVTKDAPMPAGTADDGTKSAIATQTADAKFGSIEFKKAGDYKYTVTEVNDGVDGVVYDTSAHEVTVRVVRDESTNALSATVDYGTAGKLEIENTFSAAKASIEATKDFGDFDWAKAGDGFTFELKALDGAPMPGGTSGTVMTGTATESNKTVNFGEIAYDTAGNYKYTITEQNGGKDGVTYDTTPHNVIVAVTKANDNTLSTNVYYDAVEAADGTVTGAARLSIENSFTPVTADIDVTKNFTGRKDNAWNDDDEFEFTLTPVNNAPMPAAKKSVLTKLAGLLGAEADNTATVKVTKDSEDYKETFGTVTYEETGTYEYIITETNDKKDGITYDVNQHKVVVTVTKDPETNALTAEVKYDGSDTLTVNNTYASTKAQLQATKSFADWGKADSFEFTLSAKGDAPMPADAENGKVVRTVTRDAVTAIFGEIEYLTAGEYEYVIKETKGDADGVTYDTAEHKVVVSVTKESDETTGRNELKATVKYDDKDILIITNTFKSSNGITLQATKDFADWGKADTFTFNLKADENAPMPKDDEGNEVKSLTVTKVNPTAVFGSVTFDAVGEYTYHITEVNDGKDGVSYDTSDHTIVVSVTKDDNNNLTAAAAYDKDKESVVITNTYAPAKAALQASKDFNEWGKASSFTFNLAAGKATYADGSAEGTSPMPGTAATISATATQTAAAVFGEITYEKAGTYEYTITEVNDGVPGVSYDTTAHKVVVTVTKADDATNKLTASVKYDDGTSLQIRNTYSSATSDEIKVTKQINDWGKADKFTFNIAAITDGAPMPDNTTAEATTNSRVANFGAITYETNGVYRYTITEVNGGADGVEYDTTPHEVVVTVSKADDATNKLTATVTYDGQPSLTITNKFTPVTTDNEIEVTKNFADWGKADSFTFDLAAVTPGAPLPQVDGKDVTEATAIKDDPDTDENESIAKFGKITFEKAGRYEYTITERNGGADGVSYDITPHNVVVTVTKADDATNKLKAEVKYDDKDSLTVTNTYTSVPTDEPIAVTKAFNDWDKADRFTFDLAAVTPGAPLPQVDGKDVTEATATKDKMTAEFGKITFEKAGTYEYTITERNGGADGVSYDTTPHNLVIVVKKADDATNALTVDSVLYDGAEKLTVNNTYTSLEMPADKQLRVTKAISGRGWLDNDEFEFTLAPASEGAPMPEKTTAVATKDDPSTEADECTAIFDPMTFEKTGTYEYTITEVDGRKGGLTYDTKSYKVTVVIDKKNDATNALFVKSVLYENSDGEAASDELIVMNDYEAKGTATFDAKKILQGRDLKEGEFRFELKKDGTAVGTPVANAADGSVTFSGVNFIKNKYKDETGDYTFTISEVVPDEKLGGVKYSTDVAAISVSVTDDGKGNLIVKYDGKDKAPTPEFVNTYEATGTLDFSGLKKLRNGNLKDRKFEIELVQVEKKFIILEKEEQIQKTSVGGSEEGVTVDGEDSSAEFKFDSITFTKNKDGSDEGKYTYIIREIVPEDAVNSEKDGCRYDTHEQKITVTVTDNGDGTLSVVKDPASKYDIELLNSVPKVPEKEVYVNGKTDTNIDGKQVKAGDKLTYKIREHDRRDRQDCDYHR